MSKLKKIYYLGPRGSYTEQAAKQFFKSGRFVEVLNIYQILDKVVRENNVYGVVPLENSMEGSLNIVLDAATEADLKIIGEVYLPISHCLLSKEKDLKKVRKVYAHPQALAQIGDWLRNNLPRVETKESTSNSAAAKIVAKQKNSAAVAGKHCAKIYKLNILAKQLEENPSNYTRFWILGNKIITKKANDKISIFIILNDRVAALRDLLDIFAKHKINLNKIESRALKGQAWHYGFFIDFFGSLKDNRIKRALKEVEGDAARLQILGNYQNQQQANETIEYLVSYLRKLFKQNQLFTKKAEIKDLSLLNRLLQVRFLLAPSVALYKYLNKVPLNKICQPKREQEIIKKRLVQIKKKNINASKLLIKLAEQNLLLSKEIQKSVYALLAAKKIRIRQIKRMELDKLRYFIDQIDENFDEVLAGLSKREQEKQLRKILNN